MKIYTVSQFPLTAGIQTVVLEIHSRILAHLSHLPLEILLVENTEAAGGLEGFQGRGIGGNHSPLLSSKCIFSTGFIPHTNLNLP